MGLRFTRGRRDNLETLHPAYFALVMATGIVALAADLHGIPFIPLALFWLNALFLAVLVCATLLRLRRFPRAVAADLSSHGRGVGFFTAVAACGVFGAQLVLQFKAMGLARLFWVATGILWCSVTYGVLVLLTIKPEKPNLAEGLNGGWLVVVVAAQSLVVLTCLLLPAESAARLQEILSFGAFALWLGGGALYMWLVTLIFLRYTFIPMPPQDLTPPYWINMGAVAISTLAGTMLLDLSGLSPVIATLTPFIKGLTLLYWAIASWWIPMLLMLGIWRYLIKGVPFTYDPLYWGGVFPLGMYSVCTYHLAQTLGTTFLIPLSQAFMVAALAAWATACVGLAESLWVVRTELGNGWSD